MMNYMSLAPPWAQALPQPPPAAGTYTQRIGRSRQHTVEAGGSWGQVFGQPGETGNLHRVPTRSLTGWGKEAEGKSAPANAEVDRRRTEKAGGSTIPRRPALDPWEHRLRGQREGFDYNSTGAGFRLGSGNMEW